jgi:hypothetical protein
MSIAEIKANCPDRANHQEGPKVVAEWEVWASTMWKSHIRTDCPSCGLTEHLRKAREFFGARTLIQSVVLACHAGIIRREP